MCVLYVSFGSKVRPRTFGYVAMGSAVLFILMSRWLLYSAGQVGLGVGSWPSNRTNAGTPPSEFNYTS